MFAYNDLIAVKTFLHWIFELNPSKDMTGFGKKKKKEETYFTYWAVI